MRSISVPLRHEFDLDLSGDHLLLRFGVQADMAGDHVAHESGGYQLADANPGQRGVVGDHGKPALALAHELVDDAFGRADAHEAADHQARVVRNERYRVGEWESSHRDASLK
jgi:hypothetical protein